MRYVTFVIGLCCMGAIVFCAPQDSTKKGGKGGAKKVEVAHPFYWAAADLLRGDWQGEGGYVAQIIRADEMVTRALDQVEETSEKVAHTVTTPVKHASGIMQGISTGFGTFFGQKRTRKPGPSDEMFI